MELNYDCFRQVLIVLEDKLTFNQEDPDDPYCISYPSYSISDLITDNKLKGYSIFEVFYALSNLEQAGYITANIGFGSDVLDDCNVTDITFSGHMFLKNIRDDGIWNKVKAGLGRVGGASLTIASQLAIAYIKEQIGLA